jgi:predicted TIM-barrel fold metal-dependent hydrolase
MLPPRACDTHVHIYAPPGKYAYSPRRAYDPPPSTLDDYRHLLDVLGVERAVIVTPSTYGSQNGPTLDAIAGSGGRFRGVALVAPEVTETEIARLHDGGIRGVRVTTMTGGGTRAEHLAMLADKVKDLGWVMQVHLHAIDDLEAVAPMLEKLPIRYLIDHFGRVRGGQGVAHPSFQRLLRLLRDDERCWVKLCSFYRLSDTGPPAYADMAPMARALIAACPDRLVWGTNWPHPQHFEAMPNDGDLLDAVLSWTDDAAILRRIFADNPARLFGFDEPARGRTA